MADESLNPLVIKKTQDTLGKHIKKPVLSEKLLKKPPFRFIHDIINVVIKDTGFLSGLYTTDELNSENVKDREAKVLYLQKLIDAVKLATGDNLTVRPSKIVAGHEPEKTNELLQSIGKAIDTKLDSTTAVDAVKSGKVTTKDKSSKKPETVGKSSENGVPKKAADSKKATQEATSKVASKSKIGVVKDTKTKSKVPITKKPAVEKSIKSNRDSNNAIKIKDKNVTKDTAKQSSKLKENNLIATHDKPPLKPNKSTEEEFIKAESDKQSKENIGQVAAVEKSIEIEHNGDSERKSSRSESRRNSNSGKKPHREGGSNANQNADEVEFRPTESNKSTIPSHVENDDKSEEAKDEMVKIIDEEAEKRRQHKERRSSRSSKDSARNDEKSDDNKKPSNEETKRPVNTGRRKSIESNKLKDDSKDVSKETSRPTLVKNKSFVISESDEGRSNGRPRTSLRPPSVRPASARPGAPRRRDRNVEIVLQPEETVKMAGINVKVEPFAAELEDDGENLIIIEDPTNQNQTNDTNLSQLNGNEDDGQQHGHLVQQILDTQKELKSKSDFSDNEKKTEMEWDSSMARQRQSSAKQMNSLRDSIQQLTRSINPLGKLMDFLQEDIDSMHIEMNMWQDGFNQAKIELNREKSLTQTAIEPLTHQLALVAANIKEYKDFIDGSRANILQNEKKIQELMTDI